MEEFLKLKWGIKEPHELDHGPDFLPEEEISSSYVFSGLSQDKLTQKLIEETIVSDIKQSVPGQLYKFKSNIKSFLDTKEQAQCLVALRLLRTSKKPTGFYERNCMELYNNCLQHLLEENTKFLEFARNHFSRGNKKNFKFKFSFMQKYAMCLWRSRLNRCKEYKQFYKGIDVLPYSYNEDEESAEMLQVQNILELGTLARFMRPTLLKTYHLKQGYIPKRKILYNSKQSVSKDQNIEKIIATTPADIVISSSGLTKLLNFKKLNASWDIPIVVKEYSIQNENGTISTKNVVFIDKPLPNKSPSVFELNERCVKILLKTNFCDTEAFSFQNTEAPIDILPVDVQTKKTKAIPETEKDEKKDEEAVVSDCNKRQLYSSDSEGSSTKNKLNEKEGEEAVVSDCNKRQLNSCDSEGSSTKNKLNEKESEEAVGSDCNKRQLNSCDSGRSSKKIKLNVEQQNANDHQIHHNVSYRLWKLQLKNEQCELMKTKHQLNSIQVLIRSKLDGCESLENGLLQPITVLPKLEYHLEYGAGIPTEDELVKEWTAAFFRPYSQVRRIRTHYSNGEIVAIENCNVQKITFEAQTHYQHNMHLGLGILYKIFIRMRNLTPGDYLLRHTPKDGAFVSLLKETTEKEDCVYNLYEEYDQDKCEISTDTMKTWHPIDPNFILPKHNALQQMPGMFEPCLPKPIYVKGKFKNKKKKKCGKIVKQNSSTKRKNEK